jgi:DNA-binding transcriptional LysR family regulator
LVFLEPRLRDEWMFERDGRSVRVKLDGFMTSNFGAALSTAGAESAGVVIAPSFVTRTDVAAGRLQRLLPDWTVLPELHVYAIYPHRRFLAAKVKACIEALRTTYGDGTRDPWDLDASPAARAPRAKRGSARQPTASRGA